MGAEWCLLYSTGPNTKGIANTIVQLFRRSTSRVIGPSLGRFSRKGDITRNLSRGKREYC
jgi:hypothetical protein